MFENYWNKAISFEAHLKNMSTAAMTKPDLDQRMRDKYLLNLQRAIDILRNYSPDPLQQEKFERKCFRGKILILTEGWCGDCGQCVPVVYKFFSETTPVKLLYRDSHPELMQQFLNIGAAAIPIVIFMDNAYNYITNWGPRPQYGVELYAKHKASPDSYSKEKFLRDLHLYYDVNMGADIVEEIITQL